MSRKNRKFKHRGPAPERVTTPSASTVQPMVSNSGREHVKHDLLQTVGVNLLFIVLLVGLYHWNAQNGEPLNAWINNIV